MGLADALKIYGCLKAGRLSHLSLKKLRHPFEMRADPCDYATFQEVLLREAYGVPLFAEPQFILDGGGHIGLTAVFLANRYPDAKIVTIEPESRNFALLRKNTAPYLNVEALNTCLWNRRARLAVRDRGRGNNAFVVEEVDEDAQGSIVALSIGDLMISHAWPRIDILKLDVEGSEKEIFSSNYEYWLPRTSVLIVELHDRVREGCSRAVFSALGRYEFSCSIAGENLVFRNEASTGGPA